MIYISVADCMPISILRKLTEVAKVARNKDTLRELKVIQGRRSCQQSERHIDFWLVVDSNLGRISHGFGAMATYPLKVSLGHTPV